MVFEQQQCEDFASPFIDEDSSQLLFGEVSELFKQLPKDDVLPRDDDVLVAEELNWGSFAGAPQAAAGIGTIGIATAEVVPVVVAEVSSAASVAALEATVARVFTSVSVLVPLAIVSWKTTEAAIDADRENKNAEALVQQAQARDQFTANTHLATRLQIQNHTGINAARREMGLEPLDFSSQTEKAIAASKIMANFAKVAEPSVEPGTQPIIGEPYVSPVHVPAPWQIGVPQTEKVTIPDYPVLPDRQQATTEAILPPLAPLTTTQVGKDKRLMEVKDAPLGWLAPLVQSEVPRIGDPQRTFDTEPDIDEKTARPMAKTTIDPAFEPDSDALAQEFSFEEFGRFIQEELERADDGIFGSPAVPQPEQSVPDENQHALEESSDDRVDWNFEKVLGALDEVAVDFVQRVQEQYKITRQSWQFEPCELNPASEPPSVQVSESTEQSLLDLSDDAQQSALDLVVQRRAFREATACYPNPDLQAFTVCDSEGKYIGSLSYQDWLSELLARRTAR